MGNKSKIKDMEQLEADYRAGSPSMNQVAKKHGISCSYLSRLVRQKGWSRDLGDKVRGRIRSKVQSPSVYTPEKEEEIIEAAAEQGAQVVRRQRKNVNELLDSVMDLRNDLARKIADGGDVESLSRPLSDLTRSFAQLFPAQRQAFALDAPAASGNSDDPLDEMSEVELRAYIKGCNS